MPRKKKPQPPCFRCWFMHQLIARGCKPGECVDLEMWLRSIAPIQVDKYSLPIQEIPEIEKGVKESWLKRFILRTFKRKGE